MWQTCPLIIRQNYTTQKCSACDKIVKKLFSDKTHRCPFCTFVANRDHNATRNVLRIGLRYVNAARRLDVRQFIVGSSHELVV
ncbi:MAG: transposase [Desulfobacteraceae bacterium]|nr:transposase [Desulfobacteraceae bacterium]